MADEKKDDKSLQTKEKKGDIPVSETLVSGTSSSDVNSNATEPTIITDLADLGKVSEAVDVDVKASAGDSKTIINPTDLDTVAETPEAETQGDEAKTITDLADLGVMAGMPEAAPVYEQQIDDHGRAYATGKRKDAVARVWIKPGAGQIVVNNRDIEVFFARPVLRMLINQPFEAVSRNGQYDVMCTVKGGGLSGQAGAVRHGISKALLAFEPTLRKPLKAGGFLTRDARVVERKKYGKAKARRSFQFSKR